jgi:hypothetical protein
MDEDRIGTISECDCCPDETPLFPAITRVTCGKFLSKAIFAVSVRAEIPDDAESMSWLTVIRFRNYSGSSEKNVDCDFAGTWSSRETNEIAEASYVTTYDPTDDCTATVTASGTGTHTEQWRPDACEDPPDMAITYDRIENHTVVAHDLFWAGTTYTGTQDGSPISGGRIFVPPLFSFLSVGNYAYPDWVYTLDVTSTSVIQGTSRDGSIPNSPSFPGSITESFEHGFEDPDDYRLEVAFADAEDAPRFTQLRAKVYFRPAGGEEVFVADLEIDWKKGDPPVSTHAWPYPEIGTFRLGRVLVRHSRSGKFHHADYEP